MRPLVNLVGEGHKDGQGKQVAVPGVDMVDLRCNEARRASLRNGFKRSRRRPLTQNSPGERVRKLKAMFARGTMVSMQLSPLVSMKSCRVMAVGSMWCSLNGRIKACMTKTRQRDYSEAERQIMD